MFSRRSGCRCQKEMVTMHLLSKKKSLSPVISLNADGVSSSIRHICTSAVAQPQMLADLPRSGGHDCI
jgi:hypothetical protein